MMARDYCRRDGRRRVEAAGQFGCSAVGVDVDVAVLARTAHVRDVLRGSTWLARPLPSALPGPGDGETAPLSRRAAHASRAGCLEPPQAEMEPAAIDGGPAAQAGAGAPRPGVAGDVVLTAGDARQLPFADETFDAVTARFVLQHLPRPVDAAAEMVRVVRAGGTVCVVEADDGLSLAYPEPPAVVCRLQDAYVAAQHARGGDRSMGRKAAGLLEHVGVEVTSVLVMPQAAYGPVPPSSPSRRLLYDRLSAVAEEIVALGLLRQDEVRAGLEAIATADFGSQTVVDGHVAVVGRRRC